MTQQKFDSLDFTLKAIYLGNEGELISERTNDLFIISLYALSDFFVESYYDTETEEVDRIESVQNDIILGLYLQNIKLTDLLN